MLALLLSACGGGGGGGGDTFISVSPSSLTFTVKSSELAAPQRISVQYKGSGVVAGYAPGVDVPSWLTVTQAGPTTGSQVPFNISINQTGMSPGVHRTSVRFLTGIVQPGGDIEDASDVTYTDLPVTMTVIRFSIFPTDLPVLLPEGGTTPLTSDLQIDLDPSMSWTASSSQPWLSLARGSGTGRATVRYSVSPTGLSSGVYNGSITVRDGVGRSEILNVELTIAPAHLTSEPSNLVFEIGADASAAARTQTLRIADQLEGAVPGRAIPWTARATVPWLSLSRTSGISAPPKDLVVTLPAEILATTTNDYYYGHVLLDYTTSDSKPFTLSVLVQLRLNAPITEVFLNPLNADRTPIAQGSPLGFLGFVRYAHGYQEERTQQLIWSSSDSAVASVSTSPSTAGIVQPLEPGNATIRAVLPGTALQAHSELKVEAATNVAYVINNYGDPKISQFVTDANGRLQPMAKVSVPAGPRPDSLVFTPDGKYAYVLSQDYYVYGQFGIAQFSVDPSGSLRPLSKPEVLLGGYIPQDLVVDAQGRHVYVSTRSPGGILRLDIGPGGELTMEATPPIPAGSSNQSLAAHPSAPYLYSPDFNGDRIYQYVIGANGLLTAMAETPTTGSLPQDIVVHPSGKYVYVVNFIHYEGTAGAVSQYEVRPDGSLVPMAEPTVADGMWGHRLTLSPDGKSAFLSYSTPDRNNSGETGVATFSIGADGGLVHRYDYRMPYPGEMAVDPTSRFLYLKGYADVVLQYHIGKDGTLVQDSNIVSTYNPYGIVVRRPPGAK